MAHIADIARRFFIVLLLKKIKNLKLVPLDARKMN